MSRPHTQPEQRLQTTTEFSQPAVRFIDLLSRNDTTSIPMTGFRCIEAFERYWPLVFRTCVRLFDLDQQSVAAFFGLASSSLLTLLQVSVP